MATVTTGVGGLCVAWWREDQDADIKGKLDLFTKRTKSAAEPDNNKLNCEKKTNKQNQSMAVEKSIGKT